MVNLKDKKYKGINLLQCHEQINTERNCDQDMSSVLSWFRMLQIYPLRWSLTMLLQLLFLRTCCLAQIRGTVIRGN